MFQIGEISKISQVSLRMLRYYDKNNIFKPRIVNGENGYRYYTADQLDDLYRIVELRDLGFSVAEIGELINCDDRKSYIAAIEKKYHELEQEIADRRSMLGRLNAIRSELESATEKVRPDISIVLKGIPDKNVISYRKRVANYFCEGEMWQEFGLLLSGSGQSFSNECFSLYHDLDYREEDVDIELCAVIDKPVVSIPEGLIHRQVIGCENAASIIVKGPYENISPAYREFAFFLEKHREYKMGGPNRQICHVSEIDTDNPEEYITELLIPLIKIE